MFEQVVQDVSIKSYTSLTTSDVLRLYGEVVRLRSQFRQHLCQHSPVELRIVSIEELNSADYFYWTDSRYTTLGAYYRLANVVYLTPEALRRRNIVDHELYHYLLNDCGFGFTEAQEHEWIRAHERQD